MVTSDSSNRSKGVASVVGLGKIGLPIAVNLVHHGYSVIGCDSNASVVSNVNAGCCHIVGEPELEAGVAAAVHCGKLRATTDTTAAVKQSQVVIVIVPVIIDELFRPDLRGIDSATAAIGAGLREGTLVVYETTLPVTSTSQHFAPMLEQTSGLRVGQEFYLAFSPERVRSGQILQDLAKYPKVVGGVDAESTAVAAAFYRTIVDADVRTVANADAAEYVKLIENAYRDVNIALANEFARAADAYGIDVLETINAANSQPLSDIHQPGVGVGGHCIPVYPYFLLQDHPNGLRLMREARAINDTMGSYVADRLQNEIGSLASQVILILGVAYRGGVREAAFTPARLIANALEQQGATVVVDDPLFSAEELRQMGYEPCSQVQEHCISAIVLQAAHADYQNLDFSRFSGCKVLLDGRRALDAAQIEARGIRYLAVGDGKRVHALDMR